MRKFCIFAVALCLAGCDNSPGVKYELDEVTMAKIEKSCPAGTYARYRFDALHPRRVLGVECCPTVETRLACIEVASEPFRELQGEFEDWDSDSIPKLLTLCSKCNY